MSSESDKRPAEATYNAELEWIRFQEDTIAAYGVQETSGGKMFRKFKENTFVPIGAGANLLALGAGLWSFRKGKMRDSQLLMRARIAAQGFTIVAILGGLMLGAGALPQEKQPAVPNKMSR